MSFAILESGALVLALFMALEMYRQRFPWSSIVTRSLLALALLTVMIAFWRAL